MCNRYCRAAFRHTVVLSLIGILNAVTSASAADDPLALMSAIPEPPPTLAAAQEATLAATGSGGATLIAPAYAAVQDRLKALIAAAAQPHGTVGGFDLARAGSDPAYAAEMQARMQSMSQAERMAMAQQMAASARANAGVGAGSAGATAQFMAGQRTADMAAQQKIRTLLDGALNAAAAGHKKVDAELNAAAKACPADKTGWPLDSCTAALGEKSIAQHRSVEQTALVNEDKAFADARTVAMTEVNKGRELLAQSGQQGQSGPLIAWVAMYAQMLHDYGEAIALRAGFWMHANSHKYTGAVSVYVASGENSIGWPLTNSAAARTGL